MTNPAKPKKTANLDPPAWRARTSRCCSTSGAGCSAACSAAPPPTSASSTCTTSAPTAGKPKLLSSTDVALLGHESGFAPDGRTYYASSTGGQTLRRDRHQRPHQAEADLPAVRRELPRPAAVRRRQDDVRRGHRPAKGAQFSSGGLRILDVSEIQERKADPKVRILSGLRWPEGSIAQVAEPFTKKGRHYLLEVDEFANFGRRRPDPVRRTGRARPGSSTSRTRASPRWSRTCGWPCTSPVPAPATSGSTRAPIPVQGYAGHYCSVPTRRNPRIVACSMILSGLRLFDIRSLRTRGRPATSTSRPCRARSRSTRPRWAASRCRSPPGTSPAAGLVLRRQRRVLRGAADQRRGTPA